MSTLTAKIDRFVRWFFNVSPTTAIEPQPPRRRSASSPRRARPASPKDRRDARSVRSPKAARTGDAEGT